MHSYSFENLNKWMKPGNYRASAGLFFSGAERYGRGLENMGYMKSENRHVLFPGPHGCRRLYLPRTQTKRKSPSTYNGLLQLNGNEE